MKYSLKFSFSVTLATFQVLHSYMTLAAAPWTAQRENLSIISGCSLRRRWTAELRVSVSRPGVRDQPCFTVEAAEAQKSHLFKVMWLDEPELGADLLPWSWALLFRK